MPSGGEKTRVPEHAKYPGTLETVYPGPRIWKPFPHYRKRVQQPIERTPYKPYKNKRRLKQQGKLKMRLLYGATFPDRILSNGESGSSRTVRLKTEQISTVLQAFPTSAINFGAELFHFSANIRRAIFRARSGYNDTNFSIIRSKTIIVVIAVEFFSTGDETSRDSRV
uniref:Uncharacterized protein n=1 Tax=Romanomermis culicivorax TaxID=13658 RepID=A0A915HIT8_ROMCU